MAVSPDNTDTTDASAGFSLAPPEVDARMPPGGATRAHCESFLKSKRDAKVKFANRLQATSGQVVDPDSIFDCQITRIHEYKRRMHNAPEFAEYSDAH